MTSIRIYSFRAVGEYRTYVIKYHDIMRIINLFLCVLLFCVSCTSTHDDTYEIVKYDHTNIKESYPLSTFIDTVKFIRLELPESCFFGRVGDILFDDSGIYAVDSKQDIVYRFNSDGTFLNTIGKRGEGPGEYADLTSCFLGKNSIYIADIYISRIYEYSFDGDYIGTISHPFELVYDYIRELPNGNFLCHTVSGVNENTHGVWIMDRQGKLSKRVLAISEIYPFSSSGWDTMTLQEDGTIQIYDPPVGIFYSFNPQDESIHKIFQHKSNYKMTGDFIGVKSNYYIKEEHANCDIIVNTDRYLLSIWSLPDMTASFTLLDKNTQKVENCSYPEMDIPGLINLGNWMPSNLSNTWVTCFNDEFIDEYFPEKYDELRMSENVLIVNKLIFKR